MSQLDNASLEKIKQEVKAEFLQDPALQAVHIARRTLALEAEREGMDYLEYVRKVAKEMSKPADQTKDKKVSP